MRITKITIVKETPKPQNNINDLLLQFGETLGLFSSRDKDKSCYRILIILIKALKLKQELTSDEIASQSGLSRGTVVYHLNNLMSAGIVTSYRTTYQIGANDLEELVAKMRIGIDRMIDDLAQTAKKIDVALRIKKQ